MYGFVEWMNTPEYYPLNKKIFVDTTQVRIFTSNYKHDLFSSLTPSEIETLKKAFQGGVSHANTEKMDR